MMQGYSPVTLEKILLNRLLRKGSDGADASIPRTLARELTLVRPVIGCYRVATVELLSSERDGVAMAGAARAREVAYWADPARLGGLVEVKLREGTHIGTGPPLFHLSYFDAGVLFTEGYSLRTCKVMQLGGEEVEENLQLDFKENFRLDASGRLEWRLTMEHQRVVGGRVVTDTVSVMKRGDRV